MARLPRDAGVVFYFWKHNKVVLASSSSFNSFGSSDGGNKCGKKKEKKRQRVLAVWLWSLVLSEPNWGQVRQRKSLCQRRRLSPIEQRLTFCLMNHGNPKENHTNAQSCQVASNHQYSSEIIVVRKGISVIQFPVYHPDELLFFPEGSSKIFHGVIKRSVLSNKV